MGGAFTNPNQNGINHNGFDHHSPLKKWRAARGPPKRCLQSVPAACRHRELAPACRQACADEDLAASRREAARPKWDVLGSPGGFLKQPEGTQTNPKKGEPPKQVLRSHADILTFSGLSANPN